MATSAKYCNVGAGHHGPFWGYGRVGKTHSSKLLELRFAGKLKTTNVVFQFNPSRIRKFFPKHRAPICTSNSSSSGFIADGHTKTDHAYPSAIPTKITQEEEEKEKQICSCVGGSDQPTNENGDNAIYVDDVKMLLKVRSKHNYIRVLEVSRRADHPLAGARLLLLDKTGNIYSMYFKYKILTQSYYDVFGTLPPLLPHGTLGILGMGAGTAAHLLLHFWHSIDIQGWELDPVVVSVGRKYFDLLQLERDNPEKLGVHVGNALEANVSGGFSGLIVDLFSRDGLIPDLQSPRTWQRLKERLRDGGRIMVNCGGRCVEAESPLRDGHIIMHETLGALAEVFPACKWRLSLLVQELCSRDICFAEVTWDLHPTLMSFIHVIWVGQTAQCRWSGTFVSNMKLPKLTSEPQPC